jgi:hypothetical protein
MKDHALSRHLRLEDLDEVPADRLSLAVFISRDIELFNALEQLLELLNMTLLIRGDHIERLKAILNVDPNPRPGLLLDRGRDLAR